MAVLNIEDQLCFYRAYHYNIVNVLIHLIFIPTILFSSVGFLTYINFSQYITFPIATEYAEFIDKYVFNLGSLLILTFSSFYLLLDFFNGVIFATIIIAVSYKVETLYEIYPPLQVVKNSLIIHASAWIAQFIGHGFFEHRAPALLDNLLQALVLAPFFVFYELKFLLGFNKDLKQRMDIRAKLMIAQFKLNKKNI